jgi:capsular polysaccharide biosynthesis protein
MKTIRSLRTIAERGRQSGVQAARALGLLPGAPPATGRIESLREWVDAHPDARLVELPEQADASAAPARAVRSRHPVLEQIEREKPPRKRQRVAILPGARVATKLGLVISPDNRVFRETAWDDEQLMASRVLDGQRLPHAAHLCGEHATLITQWSENYFHWLLDALPRLAVLDEARLGDLPLIVPERLSPFQRDSLALLGIHPRRLSPLTGLHVRPDVLVWPSPAGHTGHPAAWACAWLRERLVSRAQPVRTRLYVSRSGAARRRMLNEDEVVAALEPLGFEAVQPERLSFSAQIDLFASAQAVVAPHGAGLTNVVFAEQLGLLELFHPGYVNPCFYSLARAVGHHYWYLVGKPAGQEGDFVVSVEEVLDGVRRMVEA